MRRLARLLLLPGSILLCAPAAYATDPARVLVVTEHVAPNRKASACPREQAVCYADIESTLHISPDLSAFLTKGAPPAAGLDAASLEQQRQALLQALDSLKTALDVSHQILERVHAGDTASLSSVELSARFEEVEGALIDALERHVENNAAEFKITGTTAAERKKEVRRALRDIFPIGSGKIAPWIAAELHRIDRTAGERAAAVQARAQLVVRLGAFRSRKGVAEPVAIHLPGYDNIPARNLTPFDRIHFDLTEQEKQQLAEETKFNTEVIAKIEALRKEAKDNGDLLKALVAEAKTFADNLEKNLKAARTDLEADSAGLAPSLAALRTSADGLRQTIATLEKNVQDLAAGPTVPPATDANRPDLFLLQILGQLSPLQGGKAFEDVLAQAKKVRDSANALKAQLSSAPAEVRAKLQEAVQEAIDAAAADSGPLLSLINQLRIPQLDKMEKTARDLGAILDLQVGDARRFDIAGDSLQDTDLEILRSDAARGDTIDLVLEIRHQPAAGAAVEEKPIYEERKAVRIDVYDWSSGVSTGIGFIKSVQGDLSNFKPSPIAVWRISYRARPDAARTQRWFGGIQPGFGIHVATLDFDPNASVEMGAGVAVHLFSDLVQVGYGWNLSVKKDRGYWYLGIGLFDLLRGK